MDTHNEWEKDFDRRFDLDDYGDSHITQGKVKRFIADLLTTYSAALRKEWAGKVRKMKTSVWKKVMIEHHDTLKRVEDRDEVLNEVLALIEPDSTT